ncbi:putative sensor-like histidine kinase [Paenibacillus konkukensis]|uniref:Sensor-like histidine kinase n=1 Tax=Paenibacillus konkukensis TaxID=2020716 RepID=A0ABY4RUX7_9BACL|nr:sensor histidine kinase [Paenibacillus konkukensis]UQZ86085.1 putative sensor-like histidine kinase [Paenibacillus konkukensis]
MGVNLKQPHIGRSLKIKFFVNNLRNILALCLIPLLLLGSLSIILSQRYTRVDAEQNQEKLLNQYNELFQVVASEIDSLSLSFNTNPKIADKLYNILSKPNYSYEDADALYYLKHIIDVSANSRPYVHSIYVYYPNDQQRFLSSREGLVNLQSYLDKGWYDSYWNDSNTAGFTTEVRSLYNYSFESDPTRVVSVYKLINDRNNASKKGVIVLNLFPDYFVKSFTSISEYPNRSFYITDDQNRVIMQSGGTEYDQLLPSLQLPEQFDTLQADSGIYHLTVKKAPRLNWNLISVVPRKSLYSLSFTLIVITCLLALAALILCALAALWLTGKNYRQVYGILRLLESADAPDSMENVPNQGHDIYAFIITHILESFLEQKYLKIQLSERLYRMQALEFKALQSQINPHFLYNTLNSIYWKTFQLTRSTNAPSRMIELLTAILQYTLDSSTKVVRLEEEIAHTQSYVEIQQIRHKDRFQVIWDKTEPFRDCEVIKLSMQPLLENSFQYGMEHTSRLLVKVKFRMQRDTLKVTVIDNGGGIDKRRLLQIRASLHAEEDSGRHIGLSNTNKRIMLQYGETSGIKIVSKKGWGTAVTLHFPQGSKQEQIPQK